MKTIEYRTIDKTDWKDGPWKDEPDKRQWQDATTGLPCLLKRNTLGILCGYVGVPPGHPAHGAEYDDVNVDIHGGLTFAGECQEGPDDSTICHIPGAGEPDDVWWLGFDCGHGYDVYPTDRMAEIPTWDGATYRTVDYVTEECGKLAAQLARMRS